jgi:uncharacterized membrane protein
MHKLLPSGVLELLAIALTLRDGSAHRVQNAMQKRARFFLLLTLWGEVFRLHAWGAESRYRNEQKPLHTCEQRSSPLL